MRSMMLMPALSGKTFLTYFADRLQSIKYIACFYMDTSSLINISVFHWVVFLLYYIIIRLAKHKRKNG